MKTAVDITIDVFIEIPKGSMNKNEYDPVKKAVRFDRKKWFEDDRLALSNSMI